MVGEAGGGSTEQTLSFLGIFLQDIAAFYERGPNPAPDFDDDEFPF